MAKSLFSLSTVSSCLPCISSHANHEIDDGAWDASLFVAHPVGVNSISWSPACHPSSLVQPQRAQPSSQPASAQHVKKFATGGCDAVVKVWAWKEETKEWVEEENLGGHTDWVRDVAWAPNVGLPRTYLASASQVSLSQSSFIILLIAEWNDRTRLSLFTFVILHLTPHKPGPESSWIHRALVQPQAQLSQIPSTACLGLFRVQS